MYSQVKGDGKSYKFLSSRTHKAHMLKRNPRKITWTVLYRRYYSKKFPTPFSHCLVNGLAPVHFYTIMSLCDLGARLAPPFHFPRSTDSGRLMRDIVPDVCLGLHLASNTWYKYYLYFNLLAMFGTETISLILLSSLGSTRRVSRRMWPRRGLAAPRSSSVPSLEQLCRSDSWAHNIFFLF